MPLYEEKFLSPFAIRFSQARIRPTFQDGRLVDRSMSQVEAIPWPVEGNNDYDVFLNAPFPPIEIIRWRPKIREEDGRTCIDEDGKKMLGEACWFTFDNRRLYCLQAAAAKQWPRRAAAIVHIMHDLPLSRSTPRKFRTTDLGCSVRISRRHDAVPRATWSWAEATYGGDRTAKLPEDGEAALSGVTADAAKEDWSELLEVPVDIAQRSTLLTPLEPVNPDAVPQGTITNGQADRSFPGASAGSTDAADPQPHAHTAPAAPGHEATRATARPTGSRLDMNNGANLAWMVHGPQAGASKVGMDFSSFQAEASGALTVSALAAQFAQAQARLLPPAGPGPGLALGPGPGADPGGLPVPGLGLGPSLGAGLLQGGTQACSGSRSAHSEQGAAASYTQPQHGGLLPPGGPQLLPVTSPEEDEDEENCAQS